LLQCLDKYAEGEDMEMAGSLFVKQGLPALGERAYTEAIKKGRWQSLVHLATLLALTSQNERLGNLISLNYKQFSAEQLRIVAAQLFAQQECKPAVEMFLRAAILSGDHLSKFMLGVLLVQDPARNREAENAYRDAIAAGIRQGYSGLGNLLRNNPTRLSEAEKVYREGVEAGDKGSYLGLMLLLMQSQGREKDVSELAAKAVEQGIITLPPN
jgi:hypothetical protein